MQTVGTRVPIDAIYSELRQLTAHQLDRAEVVRPAALVHQAWSRLGGAQHQATERTRCLSIGAIAVRQILTADSAREQRVELGDAFAPATSTEIRVDELDALLRRLEQEDHTLSRMIQLRVFGNLSVEEAADALEIPRADGHAAWDEAGAWLQREIGDPQLRRPAP